MRNDYAWQDKNSLLRSFFCSFVQTSMMSMSMGELGSHLCFRIKLL